MVPLLALVVVVVIGMALFARLKASIAAKSVPVPYHARRTLFTPAERSFLGVLDQAAAWRHRVFGKVRLADVIGVNKGVSGSVRTAANNRIQRKHLDFVLCDPADLRVVAAIEFDDASHGAAQRRARDAFLEAACEAAGVRLVRVPAASGYGLERVRALLAELEPAERRALPRASGESSRLPVRRSRCRARTPCRNAGKRSPRTPPG